MKTLSSEIKTLSSSTTDSTATIAFVAIKASASPDLKTKIESRHMASPPVAAAETSASSLQDSNANSYTLESLRNNSYDTAVFSRLGLTDADAIKLADVLKKNTHVQILLLDHNEIGDEGAVALASALEENVSVEQLFLFHNKIGNRGARALAIMFSKRKTPFTLCYLGENLFDEEHAALIYHELDTHHPAVAITWMDTQCFRVEHLIVHPEGLIGNELIHKFTQTPNLFLEPIDANIDSPAVKMNSLYTDLTECHCVTLLSRSTIITDCRKVVEDLFISYYESLKLDQNSVFRYVSIDSGDFFSDVVNLAKLAQIGKRGKHIHVDFVDYKYADYRMIVKNIQRVTEVIQFMALLHRMGIQVNIHTASINQKPLLMESLSVNFFKLLFPDIKDPIAIVTFKLYDSVGSYNKALELGVTSPHAIVSIDAGRPSVQRLNQLTNHVKDKTAFFSLSKNPNSVRIQFSEKVEGHWHPKISPIDFSCDYELEQKLKAEKHKLAALQSKAPDPFLDDGSKLLIFSGSLKPESLRSAVPTNNAPVLPPLAAAATSRMST